jgi:D-arabinitol 2-dehydrogenase
MFRTQLLRQAARAAQASSSRTGIIRAPQAIAQRTLHFSAPRQKDEKKQPAGMVEAPSAEHEGTFARTDPSVHVEYPAEHELPHSSPVQGRGGLHFKRTLASFSLEGKVGVVTGGARGLGLVMSQALVISGADVAIVDLNSTCPKLRLYPGL